MAQWGSRLATECPSPTAHEKQCRARVGVGSTFARLRETCGDWLEWFCVCHGSITAHLSPRLPSPLSPLPPSARCSSPSVAPSLASAPVISGAGDRRFAALLFSLSLSPHAAINGQQQQSDAIAVRWRMDLSSMRCDEPPAAASCHPCNPARRTLLLQSHALASAADCSRSIRMRGAADDCNQQLLPSTSSASTHDAAMLPDWRAMPSAVLNQSLHAQRFVVAASDEGRCQVDAQVICAPRSRADGAASAAAAELTSTEQQCACDERSQRGVGTTVLFVCSHVFVGRRAEIAMCGATTARYFTPVLTPLLLSVCSAPTCPSLLQRLLALFHSPLEHCRSHARHHQ